MGRGSLTAKLASDERHVINGHVVTVRRAQTTHDHSRTTDASNTVAELRRIAGSWIWILQFLVCYFSLTQEGFVFASFRLAVPSSFQKTEQYLLSDRHFITALRICFLDRAALYSESRNRLMRFSHLYLPPRDSIRARSLLWSRADRFLLQNLLCACYITLGTSTAVRRRSLM